MFCLNLAQFLNSERCGYIFRFRFFSPKRRISVNLVDLVKNFPTSIHLQTSASIEPRTRRSKFPDTYQPAQVEKYRPACLALLLRSATRAGERSRRDVDGAEVVRRHCRYPRLGRKYVAGRRWVATLRANGQGTQEPGRAAYVFSNFFLTFG